MKRCFLVNTNETHRPGQGHRMLRNNYVCAQYGPKDKINAINKGDIVFLYQNRIGILAYGVADGTVIVKDYKGWKDEAHQMRVDRFRIAKPPVKPAEINKLSRKLASKGIFYSKTVSPIPEKVGESLVNMINEQLEKEKK